MPDLSDLASGMFSGPNLIIDIVVTLIFIIAYWKIFKKADKPAWASLVPIYNVWVMCEVVWPEGPLLPFLLLFFVPIVNIVYAIMLVFRLAKAFGKNVLFGFGLLFLSPIFILILAFGNSTYQPEALMKK